MLGSPGQSRRAIETVKYADSLLVERGGMTHICHDLLLDPHSSTHIYISCSWDGQGQMGAGHRGRSEKGMLF